MDILTVKHLAPWGIVKNKTKFELELGKKANKQTVFAQDNKVILVEGKNKEPIQK